MKKRLLAAASAAALLISAGAGIASAEDTDLFVEIKKPADQSVYQLGESVDVAGQVGAGAGDGANVVFVVDSSGSTMGTVGDKSVFEWEQVGGKALLQSLQSSNSSVNMGVVYFADSAKGHGMSTDMKKIDQFLSFDYFTPEVPSGGTSCETGLQKANELLAGVKGYKRVYFLTDGQCNGSDTALAAEVKKMSDAGIDLHSIHATESSYQCKEDPLKGKSCIYAPDPSTLADTLPGGVRATVETLKVVVKNDKGEVVKEADLSDKVGTAIVEDWVLGTLKDLPVGKYTVTADATAEGGAKAQDVATFTIVDKKETPEPKPSESPEPKPSESPKPSKSPEPKPTSKPKPGMPKTGC